MISACSRVRLLMGQVHLHLSNLFSLENVLCCPELIFYTQKSWLAEVCSGLLLNTPWVSFLPAAHMHSSAGSSSEVKHFFLSHRIARVHWSHHNHLSHLPHILCPDKTKYGSVTIATIPDVPPETTWTSVCYRPVSVPLSTWILCLFQHIGLNAKKEQVCYPD